MSPLASDQRASLASAAVALPLCCHCRCHNFLEVRVALPPPAVMASYTLLSCCPAQLSTLNLNPSAQTWSNVKPCLHCHTLRTCCSAQDASPALAATAAAAAVTSPPCARAALMPMRWRASHTPLARSSAQHAVHAVAAAIAAAFTSPHLRAGEGGSDAPDVGAGGSAHTSQLLPHSVCPSGPFCCCFFHLPSPLCR